MDVNLSDGERLAGRLGEERLRQAVTAIREDGYVVVKQVVDHEHLDILKARMDEDSEKLIAKEKWGGAGRRAGHLQQGPPPFGPYLFADVVVNPFAVQITREMLGDGFYCGFYNGNTNTPGSKVQPLHGDGIHLWGEQKVAHPAAQLIVNVCPQDSSSANGATEIWPGSHLVTAPVTEDLEAERRKTAPPIQASTTRGDLLIRDSRLWHRGVPNPSDEKRHMVATVYNIAWLVRKRTLLFGTGSQAMFEAAGVDANAEFVTPPFEYLFEMAARKVEPEVVKGV